MAKDGEVEQGCPQVNRAAGLSFETNIKERKLWVAEFCFGCWVFPFRSFCCWQCARTTSRR